LNSSKIFEKISEEKFEELIKNGTESAELDFKEIIDFNNKEHLLKIIIDIIAFSNLLEGGHLIFGITNDLYQPKGLPDDYHFDESTINSKINNYCTAEIKFYYREFIRKIDCKKYVILFVCPSEEIIYTSKDGNYRNDKEKTESIFRKGDSFYRKGSSSKRIDESAIFDQINNLKKAKNIYFIVWKSIDEISTTDILGHIRGSKRYGFNEFYYERAEDSNLIYRIEKTKENIIIVGKPLAGKTRMVYEALKRLSTPTLVLIPKYQNLELTEIIIPKTYDEMSIRIIFLDDIDRYFNLNNFELLFQQFIKSDIRIIATCQSGIKFSKLRNHLLKQSNIDLDSILSKINLKNINKNDAINIANKLNKNFEASDFDGNIGTIVFPLGEMTRRYNEECSLEAKYMLKSIKISYLAGLYRDRFEFDRKWLYEVCESLFDLSLKEYQQLDLLDELGSDKLEFIQFDNNFLSIEETYLENIIDADKEMLYLEDYEILIDTFKNEIEPLILIGLNLLNFGIKWSSIYGYEVNPEVFSLCIDCFKRCFELSPESSAFYGYLGQAYGKLEDYDEAIRNYELAVDLYPNEHQYWGNLGIQYRHIKNYEQAIYCFKKVLELNPNDYLAYYHIALLYQDLDNFELALENFNKSERIEPNYFATPLLKGNLLKKLGRFEEAISSIQKSIKLNPEEWWSYYNLAEIYATKKDKKQALSYLEKAIQMNEWCKRDAIHNSYLSYLKRFNEFRQLVN